MFVLKSGRLYSKMGILPTLQPRAALVGPVRRGLEFDKGILPISRLKRIGLRRKSGGCWEYVLIKAYTSAGELAQGRWVSGAGLLPAKIIIHATASETGATMPLEHTSPEPRVVLTRAVVRAAEQLGLKRAQLAIVLGVDEAAVGLIEQNPCIDPASRVGESGLLLVRLADGLSALAGDDKDWVQHFMRSPNKVTGGVPAQQIEQIEGLVRVLGVGETIRSRG